MAMLEEISNAGDAIERLKAPVRQAQHAPGFIYNSPEHLAREKENIFMQDWLFVAREQEVENPGDYMTFRILGEPALITRDVDGNLNAFANVCLHRGVEVASGAGNLKEFMCPYHGWLYDLTGKLMGAPYMKEAEGFDPSNCNLKRLGIETWRGYVFITFNDDPPAFADFIAPLVDDVAYLHAEDVRIGNKIEMEFPCNWKFAVENLMDFYHVGVLHSDSFGQFFDWREDGVKLNERGGVYIKYTSASPTPEGKTPFRMLPWLEAAGETERFGCMAYLAPNMHVFGRCDVVRPIQLWPNGPRLDPCGYLPSVPARLVQRPELRREVQNLSRLPDRCPRGRPLHADVVAISNGCARILAGAHVPSRRPDPQHHQLSRQTCAR